MKFVWLAYSIVFNYRSIFYHKGKDHSLFFKTFEILKKNCMMRLVMKKKLAVFFCVDQNLCVIFNYTECLVPIRNHFFKSFEQLGYKQKKKLY